MKQNVVQSTSYYDPNIPTLAQALTRLEAMPDKTPAHIIRVRSAVATLSCLMDKQPEQIMAHAPFLRQQFTRFKNNPMGLSTKTLANCKTEIRYLIKVACGRSGRSALNPLTADWAALSQKIPDRPHLWRVSKLMAYCSASNILPSDVTNETIEQFGAALYEAGDIGEPERYLRSVINAWNTLAEIIPEWPRTPLQLPPTRRRGWTIDPMSFPESFRLDADRWVERLTHIDPEAEEGPVRPLRPESVRLHRHHIFKAASSLVFSGRSVETITGLATLVDLDAFKTILRFLRERRGGEPSTAIHGLGMTLKAIARHHVKLDDELIRRMARICANYKTHSEGKTSKNRERLENFEDERLLAALLHLPARLLDEAGRPRTSKRSAATLAQVAIALEIELHAPVRIANLASLNFNCNIQVGQTRWIIRFDREETKNRALLVYELPTECVQQLTKALKFYPQTDGWLFPGRGNHKQPSELGRQVKKEVERRLNAPFNVHMMRGLVATAQVKDNNGGFEMARAMLGDRSDRVIRSHYTAAAEQHLIAKAQNTIRRARVRTAPLAPAKFNESKGH